MTTYQVGESPRFQADITATATGTAADPTTTTLKLVDSAGVVKVNDLDMTKNAAGDYYYDYTIPSTGNIGTWEYNVTATGSAGRVTIQRASFEVEGAI